MTQRQAEPGAGAGGDAAPGGTPGAAAPDLAGSPAVAHWFASARHDEEPDEFRARLLAVLAGFCAYAGRTPDDLVAGCFLRKKATGDKFVSAKARRAVNDQIGAYVAERGWTGRDAVVNGNIVRGFLIHNGVMIQGPAWTGGP